MTGGASRMKFTRQICENIPEPESQVRPDQWAVHCIGFGAWGRWDLRATTFKEVSLVTPKLKRPVEQHIPG